jgi:hypothetical protein
MGNAKAHLGRVALAVCMVTSFGALGCSKKSDAGPAAAAGTGGANAGTGAAGKGGTGGSSTGTAGRGGAGGTGSGGTGGAAAMVTCGGTACMVPMGSQLTSCCLPDNTCGLGIMTECQMPSQEGGLDPSCPAHMTATGLNLMGCCKAGNMCGVMSVSGLGCVERTHLAMFAGGPLDAMACGGGGQDAGM